MTDTATDVDTSGKTVSLASGGKVPYDKLVLSPGIDFKYDSIEGYSAEAAKAMPNAWKGRPPDRASEEAASGHGARRYGDHGSSAKSLSLPAGTL